MNKALNMVGLATRAGQVKTGGGAVESAIKAGKVSLLLIASDCSENTMDKFTSMAKCFEVEYFTFADKALLGKFSGGGEKSVVAVLSDNFSKTIKKLL